MMEETFADPTYLVQDFYQSVGVWAAIAAACVLILWLSDRGKPTSLGIGTLVMLAVLPLALITYSNYSNTVANFTTLKLSKGSLLLTYAKPFGRDVQLSANAIQHVLLGFTSKRLSPTTQCYIKLKLKDGSEHRSATKELPLASCKELRHVLEAALHTGTGKAADD